MKAEWYDTFMEYLKNRKATLDYKIEDTMETGVQLLGTEVKSVRAGHGSLAGSHVTVLNGELVLLGAQIPPWQEKNVSSAYDPYRTRKLLVHKKQLLELSKVIKTKGLTIVPLSLHTNGRLIKLTIAIVKGKNKADKRNTLKERADRRDMDRIIKETK
jgi:SsrA-binding protein